eukprot:101085-Pelagomonas_calceolata.AAC.1
MCLQLTSGIASSCGGTGLGLYLVKLALDGHNADVNVVRDCLYLVKLALDGHNADVNVVHGL